MWIPYPDVIDHIRAANLSRLIVVGPQRSGTRFGSQVLAKHLDWQPLDEMLFMPKPEDQWIPLAAAAVCSASHVVLQAPALPYAAPMLGQWPETGIVCMQRPVHEIMVSQDRINWNANEGAELARYGYDKDSGPISVVKYMFWSLHEPLIPHAYTVPYDSFMASGMWVPKRHRQSLGPMTVAKADTLKPKDRQGY